MPRLSAKAVAAQAASALPKKRAGSPRPGNGGAREKAGRKPKEEKNLSAIQLAENRIKDRLPELLNRLFQLTQSDSDKVSLSATVYLTDRVLGKPRAIIEEETTQKGGLKIIVEYSDAPPSVEELEAANS